jgi:hypothetical protein
VLARLILREFDFEKTASRDEAEAIRLRREILRPDSAVGQTPVELWAELLRIAESLRVSGGAVSRESLVAKLRRKFRLRDDSEDAATWEQIRRFSREAMEEIDTTLPGGLVLPRISEREAPRTMLASFIGLALLGEAGQARAHW